MTKPPTWHPRRGGTGFPETAWYGKRRPGRPPPGWRTTPGPWSRWSPPPPCAGLCCPSRSRGDAPSAYHPRDGSWYVTEGRKAGRYRPDEASFDLPTAYFFLSRSEPQFVAESQGVELGTHEGTTDGIATCRTALS